jgi:hypothetical protein
MMAGRGIDQRIIGDGSEWRRIVAQVRQQWFDLIERQAGVSGVFMGKPAGILGMSLMVGTVLVDVALQDFWVHC